MALFIDITVWKNDLEIYLHFKSFYPKNFTLLEILYKDSCPIDPTYMNKSVHYWILHKCKELEMIKMSTMRELAY